MKPELRTEGVLTELLGFSSFHWRRGRGEELYSNILSQDFAQFRSGSDPTCLLL